MQHPTERATYNIEEVGRILGIGRNQVYALARANSLPVPVIRVGEKRMVVSRAALDRLLSGEAA